MVGAFYMLYMSALERVGFAALAIAVVWVVILAAIWS